MVVLAKDGISMTAHGDLGTARAAGSGVTAGEVCRQRWDEKGALGEGEFSTWGTKPCLLVTMSWDCSCTLAGIMYSVLLTCVWGHTAYSSCPCPQLSSASPPSPDPSGSGQPGFPQHPALTMLSPGGGGDSRQAPVKANIQPARPSMQQQLTLGGALPKPPPCSTAPAAPGASSPVPRCRGGQLTFSTYLL